MLKVIKANIPVCGIALVNRNGTLYSESYWYISKKGSVVTWQHINLQGEYDFSDKTLIHSLEFHLPELMDITEV